MENHTEQAGAPTPNTHTITGTPLRLALAAARMTGRSLDAVLAEYIESGFEGDMEDAGRRADSRAVLAAVEADPTLRLEIVSAPDTRGVEITIDSARTLLEQNPQVIFRALRPDTVTEVA